MHSYSDSEHVFKGYQYHTVSDIGVHVCLQNTVRACFVVVLCLLSVAGKGMSED